MNNKWIKRWKRKKTEKKTNEIRNGENTFWLVYFRRDIDGMHPTSRFFVKVILWSLTPDNVLARAYRFTISNTKNAQQQFNIGITDKNFMWIHLTKAEAILKAIKMEKQDKKRETLLLLLLCLMEHTKRITTHQWMKVWMKWRERESKTWVSWQSVLTFCFRNGILWSIPLVRILCLSPVLRETERSVSIFQDDGSNIRTTIIGTIIIIIFHS